ARRYTLTNTDARAGESVRRRSRGFFSSRRQTTAPNPTPRYFPQLAPDVSRRESRRLPPGIPESSATPVAPVWRPVAATPSLHWFCLFSATGASLPPARTPSILQL